MSEPFDPRQHHVVAQRGASELRVGETFKSPSRTVTESHFTAFQVVSADNHPIHYDIEFLKQRGHTELLAHGFQVLCYSAAGAGSFPHVVGDSLLAFLEQSSKFLKRVFVGDTLYPTLTVAEIIPQRTTAVVVMAATLHNQRGELVMTGEQKYLLRK